MKTPLSVQFAFHIVYLLLTISFCIGAPGTYSRSETSVILFLECRFSCAFRISDPTPTYTRTM